MGVFVETGSFRKAVSFAAGALLKRGGAPELSGMWLRARGDRLVLSAFDGLQSAEAGVEAQSTDAEASLLVNGAGMESFLPVIIGAYPDLPVIDATAGLPFLSESGIVEIGTPEEGETENSHLWLDPQRAAGMAANLAEGLIRLMPDREQQILQNLDQFRGRLLALDETLKEELGSSQRKVIIFHEAFPYFAEACGLPVAAVVNKEPEDALPTAQLVRVAELIRSEADLPLVLKSLEEDPSVNTLVYETGVPVCELDPMTSGPEDPPLDYYETVMIRNMQVLKSSLE